MGRQIGANWNLQPGFSCRALLVCFLLCLFGCRENRDVPKVVSGEPATEQVVEQPSVAHAMAKPSQELMEQISLVKQGASVSIQLDTPAPQMLWNVLPELDGQLEDLLLDAGGVTESQFQSIAQVQSLVHLRVRNASLSNEALVGFVEGGPWKELQILNLPQANISTPGIRALGRLPKLRQLRLGGPQIDNEAVGGIATLEGLRSLHLIGPSMNEQGLESLGQAPKLASLYLDECDLDDSAWTKLFEAKPNLHVHIDQFHHDRDPRKHKH